MRHSSSSVAIVGGGIAGLATAIALRKAGLRPVVFESAAEIGAVGAGVVLAANAIKALRRIGIAEHVVPAGHQLTQFSIRDQQGRALSVGNSRALNDIEGLDNFAIHRAALHDILRTQAKDIEFITDKRATGVRHGARDVSVLFQDGTSHLADIAIVADGVHSAIRQQLVPDSTPRYAGYTCWRAVIQNPGVDLTHTVETWGAAGRVGMVPLVNGQIYWFLCINAARNDARMRALGAAELANRFKDYHAPIPQVLAATRDDQLIHADIIDLAPIPQFAFGRVLLVGDAAHATTPNMGQGACQALEDAAVLLDLLAQSPPHAPHEIFVAFERRRLKRTRMITRQSWRIGKVAQWSHPWAIRLRNEVLRAIPTSTNERQMAKVCRVDF